MLNLSKVSILIAARNEEENILDLLHSIENLSYPKNLLEILIGDDDSTDETYEIISRFIKNKPHYQVFKINAEYSNLKGKTNVLAQLFKFSTAEYIFITDADIVLPERWIETMLTLGQTNDGKTKAESNKFGVVTGVTIVESLSVFARCQAIEWLVALKLIHSLSKLCIPVTAMGNNMMVTRTAYKSVGGYEKIGFNIVEDYAIFKAIVDAGFGFKQHFSKDVIAKTKAPKNLKSYFHQRKRWLTGGMQSKSVLLTPAWMQGLLLPTTFLMSFISTNLALSYFLFFVLINFITAFSAIKKSKQNHLFKTIPAFLIYSVFFMFLQVLFYCWPSKINWKGRNY